MKLKLQEHFNTTGHPVMVSCSTFTDNMPTELDVSLSCQTNGPTLTISIRNRHNFLIPRKEHHLFKRGYRGR